MERTQVFHLLEWPLGQAPGGIVVFGDAASARYLDLRGSPFQERDLALDQGSQPWFLSQQELFMLVDEGRQELAFDLSRLGTPLAGRDFYPRLVESASHSQNTGGFVLNTVKGAWILQIEGQQLRLLNSSPLPFLASCSWRWGERTCFGGMEFRRREAGVVSIQAQWCPSRPAVLSLRFGDAEVAADSSAITLEPLAVPDRWRESLKSYSLSARQLSQLVPECCMAAAMGADSGVLMIGLLALPDIEDSLDELDVAPINSEYLGYLFTSADGMRVLSGAVFRHLLGALPAGDLIWGYVNGSNGAGGNVGSLVRIDFDAAGIRAQQPVRFEGIDSSALCASFRPRFHPRIGYFGTAEIRAEHGGATSYYLNSPDGLTWQVIGRQGEVPHLNEQ